MPRSAASSVSPAPSRSETVTKRLAVSRDGPAAGGWRGGLSTAGGGYGPTPAWLKVNLVYYTLAYAIYSLLTPSDVYERWPSSALLVLARTLLLTAVWYGGWHWHLYDKRAEPHSHKFNPQWEQGYPVQRDMLLTFTGALMNVAMELLAHWAWHVDARQQFVPLATLLSRPLQLLAMIVLMSWWSDVHFWFAHRVMHPWFGRKARGVDVGAFLYRHVHSVHHKSYNPGPWSGLAMHPFEHAVYFTRSLAPLLLGAHPSLFFFTNVRALLGPAPGHHGFASLMGSEFHYIHHAKLSCNFGTSRVVPIDNVLGTYLAGGPISEHSKQLQEDVLASGAGALGPGSKFLPADRSLRAVVWLSGLPYLLPLWSAAAWTGW